MVAYCSVTINSKRSFNLVFYIIEGNKVLILPLEIDNSITVPSGDKQHIK